MTSFAVIIPAAGSGSRTGGDVPKQFVELAGLPVLAYSLRAFAANPACTEIIVAISPQWRRVAERCAEDIPLVRFVEGGARRQDSIANALRSLRDDPDLVLVHDAARPCVSAALIDRVVAAAARHGAAVPAMSIAETVKRVDAGGMVTATIPREELRTIQTPQGFRRQLLIAAYEHAEREGINGTDDASLVEANGGRVYTVEGEEGNIKITVMGDFARAFLGEK